MYITCMLWLATGGKVTADALSLATNGVVGRCAEMLCVSVEHTIAIVALFVSGPFARVRVLVHVRACAPQSPGWIPSWMP